MFDDFLVRAIVASVGVALAAAPLGCFVIWRRMAYFGEATSHTAVLGVALGLWLQISIIFTVMGVALLGAVLFQTLKNERSSGDSILGVISHAGLALGLVMIALTGNNMIDPEAFLFGDILAIHVSDLGLIWGGGLLVCILIAWRWNALILATLNPDLARSAGQKPEREDLIFTLGIAILVAVALKVVGAILITALLIIPPAAARPFARSPEMMVGLTAILGVIAACLGLWGSWNFDTPAGASIVSAAAMIFAIGRIASIALKRA
ncbi:MAG: metal ABC transporter permease [Planktomarina sp.]